MVKLKAPQIKEPIENDQPVNPTSFISAGDRRPATGKTSVMATLRLPERFVVAVDNIKERTGQDERALILKAGILALESMPVNEQNAWLLEAMKK